MKECDNCANKDWCLTTRPDIYYEMLVFQGASVCPKYKLEKSKRGKSKMEKLNKIKKVIKENYNNAGCGLFFTRNLANDYMTTIYEEDGITIDICTDWSYFEIFGLNEEEKEEIMKYYYVLLKGEIK